MALIRKKTRPQKQNIIFTVLALIVLAAGTAAVVFLLLQHASPENGTILAYRKGSSTVVEIDGKRLTIADSSAEGFSADAETGRVFYNVASSYADGSYDLFYAFADRNGAIQTKLIDYGVRQGFDLKDGNVYYLKYDAASGADAGCVCDPDAHRIETFSTNVESIYALKGSQGLWFIKRHGDGRVLYRYLDGEATELARNVQEVHVCDTAETPHLLYETGESQTGGSRSLYILYGGEGETPELLCDDLYEALYAEYTGGNLYFFTSAVENISWSDVIADPFSAHDAEVTKPQRSWSRTLFSWLWNDTDYYTAWNEYNEKVARDEIREALDAMVESGEFQAPVFNAYVLHGGKVDRVAENIDPGRVSAVSAQGTPMLVYENIEVAAADIDMSTLMTMAQRSSVEEVAEYAKSVIKDSVKSQGLALAAYGETGATKAPLTEYNRSKTAFSFAQDGSLLFAFVRENTPGKLTLYATGIGADCKPAARRDVATGVASYHISGGRVFYLKTDVGKTTGDLFAYGAQGSEKLSNAASAFLLGEDGRVFSIKNDTADGDPTADYYLCGEGEETLIAEKVIVSSFRTAGEDAAFINEDGSLYLYSDGSCSEVDSGVNGLLLLAERGGRA